MSQMKSIGFIVAIFKPVILFDFTGANEQHRIALFHQPIDKPIPVVCALHYNAFESLFKWSQFFEYYLQVVGQSLIKHPASLFVDNPIVAIITVKIDGSAEGLSIDKGML